MSIYHCKGCDQSIDDDYNPISDNELCPYCDEVLSEWLVDTEYYFYGALSGYCKDLPPAAWRQAKIDLAESLIDDCCAALMTHKPNHITGEHIVDHYMSQDFDKYLPFK